MVAQIQTPLTSLYIDVEEFSQSDRTLSFSHLGKSLTHVTLSGVQISSTSFQCPNVQSVRYLPEDLPCSDLSALMRFCPHASDVFVRRRIRRFEGSESERATWRRQNQVSYHNTHWRSLQSLYGYASDLWTAGIARPVRHLVLDVIAPYAFIEGGYITPSHHIVGLLQDTSPSSLTINLRRLLQDVLDPLKVGLTEGTTRLKHLILRVEYAKAEADYILPFVKAVLLSVPIALLEFAFSEIPSLSDIPIASLIQQQLREHWAQSLAATSASLSCILYTDKTTRMKWTVSHGQVSRVEHLSIKEYRRVGDAEGISRDMQEQFPHLVEFHDTWTHPT
ncbi:hypothetical protein OBBRIDRAFT_248444 [Obba rivulosa]|uniref:Uncharacterized protein n=1 Tax=Obba rivulosa TaxID=1052685 RepID=A0A8E2AKI7_9APHY|nr:hypothetical protein OBBRIDRAFT_248444 [Obba rivulosa]